MPPEKGKRRPPYIVRQTTRHNKVVWYFRIGDGPRIRLPDEYGTDEFWRAYNGALQGERITKPLRRPEVSAGTLRWLIEQYKRSAAFAALAQSTRENRDRIFAKLDDTGGDLRIEEIDRQMLMAGRDRRAATPAAANHFLKAMSVLMEFALEAGLVDHNPVRDVKKINAKSEGFHTWTVAEVAAFEARHPVGTMARLAMDLMLYTGLRRSDVVRVGKRNISGDVLSIQPIKTRRSSGVTITVRILPALAESIARTDCGEKTLLVTKYGRSFAVKGFGNWFRDRCDEAGVPGAAHGLRKAAATRCAENGATASELMAMFGWTTLQEAERYTRGAERRKLGLNGSEKMLPAGSNGSNSSKPTLPQA
jgi:integrase